MATITVKEMNAQHFQVTVVANSTTEHEITVDSAYASSLCQGKLTTAALIEKSFEFLLARESNTSILRWFNLSVFGRHFPEYETEISS